MSSQNELGNALVDCLKAVSSLMQHAHSLALKQQRAIVVNDAEEITLTCKAQEEVMRRIGEADQRAADIATDLAVAAGLDPDSADTDSLLESIGFPYTHMAKHELNAISVFAEKVKEANEVNYHLLQNGLEIITCCLRSVATECTASLYSKDAISTGNDACVMSLDLRV